MDVELRPLSVQEEQAALFSRTYWSELDNARELGRPVVYCFGTAPMEVFRAVDGAIMFADVFSATCGVAGVSQSLCEVAESRGFPTELCSYARTHIGAMITGTNPMGNPLPPPDLLVYPGWRCNAYPGWAKAIKETYPDAKVCVIDVPALRDDMSKDERNLARSHVKRQIQDVIHFLEEWRGRRFDYDRLAQMVDNTGAAARGLIALQNTLRVAPTPLTMIDIFPELFPLLCLRGQPDVADYYALAKAEVDQRIAEGFAAVPGEKFRIYWDGIAIWTHLPDQFRQLARHRAALVCCFFANHIPENFSRYDPADPIGSLADWMLGASINLGLQAKIEYVSRLVTDFQANGIIMQVSRSCKSFFIDEQMMIKRVAERTGVPYCEVHADPNDPRNYSRQAIDDGIETFLTRLES